jgi:hypothetical protein
LAFIAGTSKAPLFVRHFINAASAVKNNKPPLNFKHHAMEQIPLLFIVGELYQPFGHFVMYKKLPRGKIEYVFSDCGQLDTYSREQVESLPNSEQNAQVSDTTDDDSSTGDDKQRTYTESEVREIVGRTWEAAKERTLDDVYCNLYEEPITHPDKETFIDGVLK